MKLSPSIDLLMHLAAREAIDSEFAEIQPEHLLEGLLKLAEFPLEHLEKMGVDAGASAEIRSEIEDLRRGLATGGIDGTELRRAIRARLGRGGQKADGGLHRSPASRLLFERSAGLARDEGSRVTAPIHFLKAMLLEPTPIVREVVGERGAAAAGGPGIEAPASPACQALMQVLAGRRGKDVVLVAEEGASAEAVVTELLARISSRACPPGLLGRKLVDARARSARGPGAPAEGAEAVLLLPALAGGKDDPSLARLCAEAGGPRIVCTATRAAYSACTAREPALARRVHVMWLTERKASDLPTEL